MQHVEKTVSFDDMVGALTGFIIDDHSAMRGIVRQILHQIGVGSLEEFSEGNEAWSFLTTSETEKPDFIICDLHMEGMDGLQFVNKLRRSKLDEIRDIPVIVLTGDSDALMLEVANQAGASTVMQKPVSGPDLRTQIAKILRIEA